MPKQVYISDNGEGDADKLDHCCGGKETGISLYVFKHGKETKSCV